MTYRSVRQRPSIDTFVANWDPCTNLSGNDESPAIFPLSLLVPAALGPVFELLPDAIRSVVRTLASSLVIVGMMTYLIMPRYTRRVAAWLCRQSRRTRQTPRPCRAA